MAIMSIVAVLMSFALVAAGVGLATTDFGVFFSGVSFLIVFGLTLTAAFVGYQPRYVVEALKAIAGPFRKANVDRSVLTEETGRIIRWGYLVKKHGILALEREIKGAKNQDHFLNYGVELVITGYSTDEVRGMLAAAADGYYQRRHGDRRHPQCHGIGGAGLRHAGHPHRAHRHAPGAGR